MQNAQKKSHQTRFVEYLKTSVSNHKLLVTDLAEMLNISKDSAYRRLRNETPLTIDEAMVICDKFQIDLTQFFEYKYQTIPFKFSKLYSGKKDLQAYFDGINQMMDVALASKAKVTFAAEDIPVFHHFEYPNLAGFKIFYWQKAVLNDEKLIGHQFSLDTIHPELLQKTAEIIDKYNHVNCEEIWTIDSIHSTLSQILYFAESGQFKSKEYAIEVLTDLECMVEGLMKKAERSSKTMDDDKNFVLYNSEVRIGNNSILIETEDAARVFISHNTFNSISTENENFCIETRLWMQNLIRKSTPINDVSEKHRFQFFRSLFTKIEEAKQKVLIS
ncbi:MAG: hypothetical protein ACI8SE_001999 [Bacteroidia bacterium]|jgi:hypothetical protein